MGDPGSHLGEISEIAEPIPPHKGEMGITSMMIEDSIGTTIPISELRDNVKQSMAAYERKKDDRKLKNALLADMYVLAAAYSGQKRYNQAKACCQQALEIDPEYFLADILLAYIDEQ